MFDNEMDGAELAALFSVPREECSPAQLVERIAACERVIATVEAAQLRDVAAFGEARSTSDRALAGVSADMAGRIARAELAAARGVKPTTAEGQLLFARMLVEDHPRLLSLLGGGRVSLFGLRLVVKETAALDADDRRLVDDALAELASQRRMTPFELREAAARQVIEVDPGAAMKRCVAARADRRISAREERDGTGTLWSKLKAEEIVACWETLDSDARAMRGDGDERSIQTLMCDLLVERVTGFPVLPQRDDIAIDSPPSPSPLPTHRRSKPRAPVELQVVMAASTLMGVDDAPATLRGFGAIPAELGRQIADGPDTVLRRLVCDPLDGRLVMMDTKTRCYQGPLRQFVIWRDQTCRAPGCDNPIKDIDHILEYAAGGPTTARNGEGVDRVCHDGHDHPGVTITTDPSEPTGTDPSKARLSLEQLRAASPDVLWTMPTGHTYRRPPPPALGLGATPAGRLRPRRRVIRSAAENVWLLHSLRERLRHQWRPRPPPSQ